MAHQNIRRDQTYDSAHKRGKILVAKTKADCDSQNLQIDQDYSKFKDSDEHTERIRQEVWHGFHLQSCPLQTYYCITRLEESLPSSFNLVILSPRRLQFSHGSKFLADASTSGLKTMTTLPTSNVGVDSEVNHFRCSARSVKPLDNCIACTDDRRSFVT